MAVRFIKPSKLFNKLLKLTLGKFLNFNYNIDADNACLVSVEPPYILLANHTNTWDPFILSNFVEQPVCFVTSDFHFRKPLLRFLLSRLVGAIPKSKAVSDLDTIKTIFAAKKSGSIIGIFPEGQRCWDGKSLGILPSTSKLIRNLDIPVVTCIMKGAYLSLPRWAKKRRKGKIHLDFKVTFKAGEAGSLSLQEIQQRLEDDLRWDEYKYQRENMIAFKCRKPANYLELFLFTCPECGSIGSMESQKDDFFCKNCHFTVKINSFGFYEGSGSPVYFSTPDQWNKWQLEALEKKFEDAGVEPIFSDSGVIIKRGLRSSPLKKFGFGSITMFRDRIEFHGISVENMFYVNGISGINVQFNDIFEFYYEKSLYTFIFKSKRFSAYKWVEAVNIAKKSMLNHAEAVQELH